MTVELGLAIVGTIDLCFQYGKLLIDLYEKFKAAERLLSEQVLRLENLWLRTTEQLNFLKTICQTLSDNHLRIQKQNLDVLDAKLKVAVSKIEGVVKKVGTDGLKVKKFKFAIVKESLDSAIDELELWQKLFDPSWFLIMKLASGHIDHALQSSQTAANSTVIQSAQHMRIAISRPAPGHSDTTRIFLPESGLQIATSISIPGSDVQLVQRTGSSKWLLTEDVANSTTNVPTLHESDVRDIARRLCHANPTEFNLLNCYGVVRHYTPLLKHPSSYTFIFRLPENISQDGTNSLRGALQTGDRNHTLSERFYVAQYLARAISYVHSFGFVHKDIRPETILLLKGISTSSVLGNPFLVGFDAFRSAEGKTARIGDNISSLNIYRHPSRQGEQPAQDYIMQHDIYSLGVCLLELGLFENFIQGSGSTAQPNTSLFSSTTSGSIDPDATKDQMVNLAQSELRRLMGTKYSDVVVTCLTCLDPDNLDFGDSKEFEDEDGIAVGVRYIEKVLGKLNEISV